MSKKKSSKKQKTFFDTKEKIIKACVWAGVVLLLIFVLMSIESGDSKLIVKNNTDLKLDYVSTKYVKEEEEDGDITEAVKTGSIAAHKTYSKVVDPVNLMSLEATCNIEFKFEDHDVMFIDAGYFNENFSGKTKITFSKTEDPNKLKMTVKAGNGLLSSNRTQCDEVFTVDLGTGKVYGE